MGKVTSSRLMTKDDPMFKSGGTIVVGGGLTPGLIRGWARWKREQEKKKILEGQEKRADNEKGEKSCSEE